MLKNILYVKKYIIIYVKKRSHLTEHLEGTLKNAF